MSLIKGTHHVSLWTGSEEKLAECERFYRDLLGLEVLRRWERDGVKNLMLIAGGDRLEFNTKPGASPSTGSINHFALATDDVDACVKAVREAGYRITTEPKDVLLPSEPPVPIRIAFCIGPIGEEIEFCCEK